MKKVIIILSIVALLGTAAYFYYMKQAEILEDQATYEVTKIVAEKLDAKDTRLQLQLKITNPSTLQARITSLDIDFFINKIKVAKITENGSFILPAKGFTFVDLRVAFSPEEIYGDVYDILTLTVKLKDATVDIDGSAKVLLGGFIPFSIPIAYGTTAKQLIHSS